MAAGDLVSVTVIATGWEADVKLSGLAVAGTYDFGLGANNNPATGTPKITFTSVSLGFDTTGAATTITRTAYGTTSVRWPFSTASIAGVFTSGTFIDGETVTASISGRTAIVLGAQSAGAKLYVRTVSGATNAADVWTGGTSSAVFTASATHSVLAANTPREVFDGTDTTVRISLSDYIFQKDATGGGNSGTAPVVNLLSAFYTSGGTPNAASGAGYAVTNSSTAAYPKVVANWSRPPFERITGNYTLGVAAFAGTSAFNGATQTYPGKHNIACVVFSLADTSAHTATTTVATPSIDSGYGDAVPVIEFLGTMDVSTLTALNILTANFIAYPIVGDSTSILDSSAGTAQPTALVGPRTYLLDKSNTYGVTVALVTNAGSDAGANTVYDAGSFDPTTAYQFASINKAAQAIRAYNNTNHSRNDVSGGIIYLADGTYAWTGAANSTGTTNDSWIIVTRASNSTNRASVIIGSSANNQFIAAKCLVRDVTISSASSITFADQVHLWVDNCTITTTGTALIYSGTHKWLTRNTVSANVNGVFRPYSTETSPPCLIRGNTVTGYNQAIYSYTVLGNNFSAGTCSFSDNLAGMTIAQATNHIVAFNLLSGTGQPMMTFLSSATALPNCAIVQNLFEGLVKAAQPLVSIAADGTTVTPINNLILWHNTIVGQRENWGYNDTGTASAVRQFWSAKGNIAYDSNIKSDTFSPESGARIGNWSWLYMVGCSGNLIADSGNGFDAEFAGLNSAQTDWTSPNPNTLFDFVDYKAYNGTGADGTAGTGGGDYHLNPTAPTVALQRDLLVPFDFEGATRSATDASGIFHFGDDNTRNFFFLL